jgi:hypothetical protein
LLAASIGHQSSRSEHSAQRQIMNNAMNTTDDDISDINDSMIRKNTGASGIFTSRYLIVYAYDCPILYSARLGQCFLDRPSSRTTHRASWQAILILDASASFPRSLIPYASSISHRLPHHMFHLFYPGTLHHSPVQPHSGSELQQALSITRYPSQPTDKGKIARSDTFGTLCAVMLRLKDH